MDFCKLETKCSIFDCGSNNLPKPFKIYEIIKRLEQTREFTTRNVIPPRKFKEKFVVDFKNQC